MRISISNSLALVSHTSRLDAERLLTSVLLINRHILDNHSERIRDEDELVVVRELVAR